MITPKEEVAIREQLATRPFIIHSGCKVVFWWVLTCWRINSIEGGRNIVEIATIIDGEDGLKYGLPSNRGMRCEPRHNPEFWLIGPVERPTEEQMTDLYERRNK